MLRTHSECLDVCLGTNKGLFFTIPCPFFYSVLFNSFAPGATLFLEAPASSHFFALTPEPFLLPYSYFLGKSKYFLLGCFIMQYFGHDEEDLNLHTLKDMKGIIFSESFQIVVPI